MTPTPEQFRRALVDNQTPITIFLLSGIKLHGIIVSFDDRSLILERADKGQEVMFHAISTICRGD